jgi:hypothetical protein
MKTGTLLLLGGIALLAVKSGALGRLASAAPDAGGGGGDPVDSPIHVHPSEIYVSESIGTITNLNYISPGRNIKIE